MYDNKLIGDELVKQKIYQQLAVLENQSLKNRQFRIEAFLSQNQIPYKKQVVRYKNKFSYNIIIEYTKNRSTKETIILGGHYDPYNDYLPAANDNGSGISILLIFASWLFTTSLNVNVTIVLFTFEEKGLIGSQTFLSYYRGLPIKYMVNLDTCGTGDVIIIDSKNTAVAFLTEKLVKLAETLDYEIIPIMQLPVGDDQAFFKHGIPSVSIAACYSNDVIFFSYPNRDNYPKFIERLHTSNDISKYINPEILNQIFNLLKSLTELESVVMPKSRYSFKRYELQIIKQFLEHGNYDINIKKSYIFDLQLKRVELFNKLKEEYGDGNKWRDENTRIGFQTAVNTLLKEKREFFREDNLLSDSYILNLRKLINNASISSLKIGLVKNYSRLNQQGDVNLQELIYWVLITDFDYKWADYTENYSKSNLRVTGLKHRRMGKNLRPRFWLSFKGYFVKDGRKYLQSLGLNLDWDTYSKTIEQIQWIQVFINNYIFKPELE